MKPTDTNIAKYYGVSRETLRNYRKGAIEKQRLYKAMKAYFIEEMKDDWFKKYMVLCKCRD